MALVPLTLELDPDDGGWADGRYSSPHGLSLNALLATGDKSALINPDLAVEGAAQALEELLAAQGSGWKSLSFLVATSLHPRSFDSLAPLATLAPQATLVLPEALVPLVPADLRSAFGTARILGVKTLPLGSLTLEFQSLGVLGDHPAFALWIPEEKTLVTGLAFGAFGWVEDKPYEDQFTPGERDFWEDQLTEFFALVAGGHREFLSQALSLTAQTAPQILVPLHGPLCRRGAQDLSDFFSDLLELYDRAQGQDLCLVTQDQPAPPILKSLLDLTSNLRLFDLGQDRPEQVLGGLLESRGVLFVIPGTITPEFRTLVALITARGLKGRFLGVSGLESPLTTAELEGLKPQGWNLLEAASEDDLARALVSGLKIGRS